MRFDGRPMIDDNALRQHLDALGWRYEPHGVRTYRSVHETAEGKMAVYVRLADEWLVASIVPFLATRGRNSFELSRWLLRMNRDMAQTKFAYDEDGDVVLTVELPTESLDFGEIRAAFEGLIRHGVEHRATLRAASSSSAATSGKRA